MVVVWVLINWLKLLLVDELMGNFDEKMGESVIESLFGLCVEM